MKLSDKVTLTRAFTARKKHRPVIVFSHRVSPMPFFKNGIGETLRKNTMTGRFFLRAVKALVRVTLSDSFMSLAQLSAFTNVRNLR